MVGEDFISNMGAGVTGDKVGMYATKTLNVSVIAIAIILGLAILGFIIYFIIQQRKWGQYKCIIWTKDAFGNPIQKIDKAGVFVDKVTRAKRFFTKYSKANLSPDDIPVVFQGKHKLVYLRQLGSKNFEYVTPNVLDGTTPLRIITEQDVNWALQDYEKAKDTYAKNLLMQYLPYIALALVGIIIMIIFVYFFKKLDALQSFGSAIDSASKNILEAVKLMDCKQAIPLP